ncbi:MAG: hypothetical protein A2287_07770 [Candidatus Melainabacteria bacterium RIFOXYA12_FULL_32_12]|nr:MAG: hypothetical protein A2287_07770 [Candidatus Melainabacteria bacterium RIFOXYA12_FULL_32_12]
MNLTTEKVLLKINKNKNKFGNLLKKADLEKNESKKLQYLLDSAHFASYNVCHHLCSSKIENELINISKKYNIPLNKTYEKNSFLHVLTEAFPTGGHTRVTERWIKNSPAEQKHSVILLKQKYQNEIPDTLRQNVKEKNGDFIVFDKNTTFVESALQLRKIASGYENIILHVHMEDIVPILAFGTEEFKRPVVFFNHGDHIFWLGVSISDLVVNFRTCSNSFNEKYRHVKNNAVLPLPICSENIDNIKENTEQIIRTKQELGFQENSKVILTMASSYKYAPFDNYNFINTISEILKRTENTILLAIGPDQDEESWYKAFIDSKRRINAIGRVEHQNLEKYLAISDLAIDSFPISSFTALLDIAKYNIPSLALKTPLNDLDSFNEAGIFSETQEQLINIAVDILSKNSGKNRLFEVMQENHFEEGFQKHLINLYKKFPQEHKLYYFNEDKNRELTDLEIFVCKNNMAVNFQKTNIRKIFLIKIPFLLEIYKTTSKINQRMNIKFFGINISFKIMPLAQ